MQASAVNERSPGCGCENETKAFLSSPVYYIFVIVVTISIFTVLLVELIIDALLYTNEDENYDELRKVSIALHWFAFAVLVGFLVEVSIRILAWRTQIFKDCILICDSLIVVVAVTSNFCATLIAGPKTPYDSISLVIVLRLVRIHSLIRAKTVAKTRELKNRNVRVSEELRLANYKIASLQRAVREKDYEITQMQAHLGNAAPNQLGPLSTMKKGAICAGSRAAAADADLELAIALSKQSLDEGTHGAVNKAFLNHRRTEEADMMVLVHERPDETDSMGYNTDDSHKVVSHIDEYFSRSESTGRAARNRFNAGTNPNAMNLPIQSSASPKRNFDTLQSSLNSLSILQPENHDFEPISICVDPSILDCESPVSETGPARVRDNLGSVDADETNCERASDMMGSVSVMKSPSKNSDSSVSCESGYSSTESDAKKKLAASTAVNDGSDSAIATSRV